MRTTFLALLAMVSVALAGDEFEKWKKQLPKDAKAFRDADDIYWREWYRRGFSPSFAWKNTDPRAVHTFARPLLKSER